MKPATLARKTREVEREGVTQAKMWLGASYLGPQSVHIAWAVLVSTYARTEELRETLAEVSA